MTGASFISFENGKQTGLDSASARLHKLAGLSLAALVPAFFWSGVVAATQSALSIPVSLPLIAMTAGAVAVFLAAVCAPLMLRPAH